MEAICRKLFWPVLAAVACFGVYLRLQGIADRSLEYDEIWTFFHYVNKDLPAIFSDLATPNNHPLHSLAVKYLGANSFFTLRLPALLAGLCIPPLAGFLAWRLLKDKLAGLVAFSFCALNGGLIHYAQTARGYSMQTLFVLGAAFALFALQERPWERRLAPVVFLLTASAAILTIPSGIVFIAPLGLLWLILNKPWRNWKGCVPELISFGLFGLVCLAWYGVNYAKFKAGQTFGDSVTNPLTFLNFAVSSLWEISGFWFLLMVPGLLCKKTRTVAFIGLAVVALALLSALATKAGPPRVYLPLVPFIGLAIAAGLMEGAVKRPIEAYLLTICFLVLTPKDLAKWTPIDWRIAIPQIIKEIPEDTFLCYPAGAGYELGFNCGELVEEGKLNRIDKFEGKFAQVACQGALSVADTANQSEIRIATKNHRASVKMLCAGIPVEIYNLRPLKEKDILSGKIVFAVVAPINNDSYDTLLSKFFTPHAWKIANPWRRMTQNDTKSDVFLNETCPNSVEELLELSRKFSGKVQFFVLD